MLLQMEYQYFHKKYDLSTKIEESAFCIVSPFRNLKSIDQNEKYFRSLNAQNYTSFKIIMIDDNSTDDSIEFIQKTIKKYPKVNNRLLLLKN